jgi:hypothetical protein
MLGKELQQRLTEEYRYAVTKMQEVQPARKLFYFSVFYGEAQRILNFEWNRDLALIYAVTFHVYTQINTAMQSAALTQLPIDWTAVYDKLTLVASDLVAYLEKAESDGSEELCQILGRFAEISFSVSGNGIYLYEKGSFKF